MNFSILPRLGVLTLLVFTLTACGPGLHLGPKADSVLGFIIAFALGYAAAYGWHVLRPSRNAPPAA